MPKNTEIKYRLVIEGVGVDFDSERDEFIVTVQTADAQAGESSAGSKSYTSRGGTVAKAVASLTEQTGRYPLYSQNRVIILGDSVRGENVIRALNFFVREYTSRPDVYVVAATGSAGDLLTASDDKNSIARLIETEIDLSRDTSVCVDTELFDCVNISLEEGSDFVLPLAEITGDKEKTVKITGSAVGSAEKKVHLSDSETFFLLLATDKVKKGTLQLKADRSCALEIMKSRTKIKTELIDGTPCMMLDIGMTVDVIEYGSENFTDLDEDSVRKIEAIAENHISSGVSALCERMLRDEACDIFRLGKRLSLSQRENFIQDAAKWREALPAVTVKVSADVRVGRIGQMTVSKQIEK